VNDQTDSDVAGWLRERDEAAARRLTEALYPQVIRIVRGHLPRGMEEQELAQEVFVRFFNTLGRYDPARPLENWVARLALNVCLNALRARRRRSELAWSDLTEAQQAIVEGLASEPAPSEPSYREAKELVAALLETLSPEDRLVVTLLYLEERSLAEVRALTGWAVPVLKMRAFRARRRLHKRLAELDRQR
jgi:RNA polymerase sigma-70 factor (ECF subfamily)